MRFFNWITVGIVVSGAMALGVVAAPPAPKNASESTTQPAAALRPGWEEIDQRLVFLTVELSTVESTIDATNKALKAKGYQQAQRQAAAEQARKGNEAMDRNGGGPVPWQEFYGKTAQKFFYHPVDDSTVHLNPDPIPQRPPQFDYIYRANEHNRAKAEEDVARIGDKIDDLLEYRRRWESEQSALWAKIALRGVSSLEIASKPIYRMDLSVAAADDAAKQSLQAARAAVQFMRAIDSTVSQTQKDLAGDQKASLEQLLASTSKARTEMQAKLLTLAAMTESVGNPRSAIGQFTRSAKRLEDSAQNVVDAYRLAEDCDARGDQAGMQTYRGQLQQMLFDYASTVLTADQGLSKAISDWKISTVMASATPPPAPPASNPSDIGARLDQAKATHEKEVAAARRTLLGAIDARLDAAADAGDLGKVQALQAAKMKAAGDGSLPADLTDETILAAKAQMTKSISAANERLVGAYHDAIASYTRARKITEAQAIQDELNASNLGTLVSAESSAPLESAASSEPKPPAPQASASDSSFPAPNLPVGRTEVDLPAPVDAICPGGGGRYLVLHLPKLQQLAIFDVSQLKVLKYLPMPSNDIVFTASDKKLFIGLKTLRQLQRWDLSRQERELSVAGPEHGIITIAAPANAAGPLMLLGEKRLWMVNPSTLKCEKYPSKNWGDDGAAGGPFFAHVSFDGSTVVVCGGGWAGIEVSNVVGSKPGPVSAGYYVNGDTLVAGNGALVFPNEGGVVRSDLQSRINDIEGTPFPAVDPAFSVAFRKEGKTPTLTIFSNSDPRPLFTLRDLPELARDIKLPIWQRVQLMPRAHALITVGEGGDKLILRKFDLADELESAGIDYLFVESSPIATAQKGSKYVYKMQVRSKKGNPKLELQSGPSGMTISRDGTISWAVPARFSDPNVTVVVQVSDASGQTIFHNFVINISEAVNHRRE